MQYDIAATRDLVWVLQSPPMFRHKTAVPDDWGRLEIERNRGLLSRLDTPGSRLQKAVARRSTNRLGEYFEILLRTWLEEIGPARLLGSNVQVQGSAGTVGEFDLLFARDRAVHHWELAVKYYLGYPGKSGPLWIGPNPDDVLHVKWKKLRRQQLALSRDARSEYVLRRLGVRPPIRPRAFVKGYLFDALDPRWRTHDHPHVHPDALRGFWVHHGQLAAFSPPVSDDVRWIRLGRLAWLADPVVDDGTRLDSLEALSQQFRDEPLHVAGVAPRDDGTWETVTRGFLVPDGWPGKLE